jgi:hypothetical protein
MKTLKQLFREFCMPLVLALLWALYNLQMHAGGAWDFTRFLNVFIPSFVFISYLLAQWFRVQKQQKVESGISKIESKVLQLIKDLDTRTHDLIGHVNGGESFCHLVGGFINAENEVLNLTLHHDTEFQLYDIHMRIVDLQVFKAEIEKRENIRRADTNFHLDAFLPGYAHALFDPRDKAERAKLNLGSGDRAAFNVFFTARNGHFFQYLRFARADGIWRTAFQVSRDKTILLETVDDHFPRDADGQVVWEERRDDSEPSKVLAA